MLGCTLPIFLVPLVTDQGMDQTVVYCFHLLPPSVWIVVAFAAASDFVVVVVVAATSLIAVLGSFVAVVALAVASSFAVMLGSGFLLAALASCSSVRILKSQMSWGQGLGWSCDLPQLSRQCRLV